MLFTMPLLSRESGYQVHRLGTELIPAYFSTIPPTVNFQYLFAIFLQYVLIKIFNISNLKYFSTTHSKVQIRNIFLDICVLTFSLAGAFSFLGGPILLHPHHAGHRPGSCPFSLSHTGDDHIYISDDHLTDDDNLQGIIAIKPSGLKSWEGSITFCVCTVGFVLGLPIGTEVGNGHQ